MEQKKISLLSIARYANKELLLAGWLQTKSPYQALFLEQYKKKSKYLKFKTIATKIIYSIIFGILPIVPILTYFQIHENLMEGFFPADNIIFTGSLFFGLYFTLQFFNFLLMGLLESGMVMSGGIFEWFGTLPISKDKLHKLAYLTIFRSFDIPIVVIVLGFPIIMFIGTQDIIVFLVCLGISILNIIFSFDILILFGERLNRILENHEVNSKKALSIRLFNIISYLIIILGSLYLIQWALGSIGSIFQFVLNFERPAIINLIVSAIPYPFNPSYLVLLLFTYTDVSIGLWISILSGLGLFILLTWWIHLKTSKTLNKITSSESIKSNRITNREEIKIKIKISSSMKAFLHKDLSFVSHDLKTFLSMIMPIILSFIFTFSFNIGIMGGNLVVERDIFVIWIGILIFTPVISGMLVYSILGIEVSGESVLASLPIEHREHAQAKLLLMIVLQTLATLTPSLLYITNSKFLIFFLTSVISIPFVWILLILTFELKIHYFSKFKNHYVIGEINPKNRIYKWVLIICIQYIIIFWMISFAFIFFVLQLFVSILIFYGISTFICFIIVFYVFEKTFPKIEHEILVDGELTTFIQHRWIGIVLVSILYFINLFLSSLLIYFYQVYYVFDPNMFPWEDYYNIFSLFVILLFNLSYIPLILFVIPKVLGLPNGKQPIGKYLESIKVGWIKLLPKFLLWACVGFLAIIVIYLYIISTFYPMNEFSFYISYEIFGFILFCSRIFWEELLFRGVILTIILRNRKKLNAIILNALVVLIFYLIPLIFFPPSSIILFFDLVLYAIFIFSTGIILAFLFAESNSILPGVIAQIVLYIIGIPVTYYWIFA